MATWLIEITDLNGANKPETSEYITDAIRCWANGSNPDHPFYGSFLDKDKGTLHVRELTEKQADAVKAALRKGA